MKTETHYQISEDKNIEVARLTKFQEHSKNQVSKHLRALGAQCIQPP